MAEKKSSWWDSIKSTASEAYDYLFDTDYSVPGYDTSASGPSFNYSTSPGSGSTGSTGGTGGSFLSKPSDIYQLIDTYKRVTGGGGSSSSGGITNTSDMNPYARLLALGAGGLGGFFAPDLFFGNKDTAGYKGSIPEYDAVRARVPDTFDPNRRPGSGGQRYFSDIQFVPQGEGAANMEAAATEAKGLAALNRANPASYPVETMNTGGEIKKYDIGGLIELIGQNPQILDYLAYATAGTGLGGLGAVLRRKYKEADKKDFNEGGMTSKKQGIYLDGATDGMADEIPAMIDGEQPAMLSDGEFVIPADVVSHLGNGNSDAGAKELETMMNEVRMARTGTKKQAPEIDPQDFLPT